MEKSRAIELLEHLAWDRDIDRNPYGDALNIAIDALKAQLSREGITTDMISRQAAIDAIRKYIGQFDAIDVNFLDGLKTAINLIKELPSAQPEPQWIPVSERLPEDMQFVLLTVRRLENGYNHEPFISVGYIGWNHQHWWCAHDGDCEISEVEVIAWMPLPAPYKKGAKE